MVSGPHSKCAEILDSSQLKCPSVLGRDAPQGRYRKKGASQGVLLRMATQGGHGGRVGERRQSVRKYSSEKGHTT